MNDLNLAFHVLLQARRGIFQCQSSVYQYTCWPASMSQTMLGTGEFLLFGKTLIQQHVDFVWISFRNFFPNSFDLKGSLQVHSCTFVVPWDKLQRLGEAKIPGPDHKFEPVDHVRFSLVNPTGLFKKKMI